MSSTVTSWSPDTNTKASETTSTALNNATLSGTLTVSGATQLNSTLTVGVDDTGYDVKFFGATSGRYILWDEDEDSLELSDNVSLKVGTGNDMQLLHDGSNSFIVCAGTGELRIATIISGKAVSIGHTTSEVTINDNLTITGTLTSPNISGNVALAANLDVDGTTNLDAVDIDGAVQLDGTLTVGVDDTGYDVKFFAATAGEYMLWEQATSRLTFPDNAGIQIGNSILDTMIYHDGTDTFISSGSGVTALKIHTATSGAVLSLGHTTSETTINDNLTITGTIIGTRASVANLADNGSIPITSTCINIDANGSARTGIRFAGAGTAGQMIFVNNTGGEALTFHNTEGTALVRGIAAAHDTMEANFMGMFVSDGTYWNLIAGGVDTQPDVGLTAS